MKDKADVVKKNDIAAGAVTARNLAPGIVTNAKLAPHAVAQAGLDNEAVTGRTLSPHSVHGLTLTGIFQPVANVRDADPTADDLHWTSSTIASAMCPPGAMLLNGGIEIQTSAFHKAFVQSTYPSSGNASTWLGQTSTDTGGASPGQLSALCLD